MAHTGTLTPAQCQAVDALRDSWLAAALSTERCDRAAAEAAVREAYTAAGLDAPPLIVWMDSPLGGAFASAMVGKYLRLPGSSARAWLADRFRDRPAERFWNQLEHQLGDALADQVRGRRWEQVTEQLCEQLFDQLAEQFGEQLRIPIEDGLSDQLEGRLRDQLVDRLEILEEQLRNRLDHQLFAQVGDLLGEQLGRDRPSDLVVHLWDRYLGAWNESYRLAHCTCTLDIAGLPASRRLETLATAVRHTGMWWPMRGAVVLSDRPTVLERDRNGRLHCDTGPALAYADGYRLHSWHGTTVPAGLITEDWTVEQILAEPNTEVRRCAVEKCGWDRFVVDAGLARIGQEVPDPGNPGQHLGLYELPARLRGLFGEPARVLLVSNASPDRDGARRRFGMPVPADISDPLAAAASLFDVSPADYAAITRAT